MGPVVFLGHVVFFLNKIVVHRLGSVVTTGVVSTPMPLFCSASWGYQFNLSVILLTETLRYINS